MSFCMVTERTCVAEALAQVQSKCNVEPII